MNSTTNTTGSDAKRQAGAQFRGIAQTIQLQRGVTYDQAWKAAKEEHPDIFAKMSEGDTNPFDVYKATPGEEAVRKALGLGATANARTELRQRIADVVTATQKEFGTDYDQAFRIAESRHPDLFRLLGTMSGSEAPATTILSAATKTK
jgi:hypothetical protein